MSIASIQLKPLYQSDGPVSGLFPTDNYQLLLCSPLFHGISIEQCCKLANLAVVKTFQEKEVIFMQGQAATQLILIESGSVKCVRLGTSSKEMILWLRGTGDILGDTSVLDEVRHPYSASTIQKCKVLVWDLSVLRHHIELDPVITKNVGIILSRRLLDLEGRFCDIATKKVSQCIALAVLQAMNSMGNSTSQGIELCLSQKEISQMSGTNSFAVSRQMAKWHAQGLVSVGISAFIVRDPERFRAASEQSNELSAEETVSASGKKDNIAVNLAIND